MIEGGEDPKFIARRLIISASEDIGLANPTALIMANNTFQAVNQIGWPEARIILSQCTIYLANSPKGNAAYKAINKALDFVQKIGYLPVPANLKNAPTQLMKELGYGKDYRYPHNYPDNFLDQEYMPEGAIGNNFYSPGSSPKEKEIEKRINFFWKNKYSKE
jgi:ATPase related to the helicase subunit of the Holliday junction resolvase